MRTFFAMLLLDGYAVLEDSENDNEKPTLVGGGRLNDLIRYLKLREVNRSEIVFVNLHKKIELKLIKTLKE